MSVTAEFYETSYRHDGFGAQRRYPNEELCRFMGRRFFGIPRDQRGDISILEVGCGSGANLWMIAAEGFDAHGLELAPEGAALCSRLIASKGLDATVSTGCMTKTGYPDRFFDAVVDVFSSYCLDESQFNSFVGECRRILKPGGRMFFYTPSKTSDAFKDFAPSTMIDGSTLNGIYREGSPFGGNHYPFRFTTNEELGAVLKANGFAIDYSETVCRSYRSGAETFEFVVLEASCQS